MHRQTRKATHNSTYPKGGVLCFKDRFMVTGTFVLLINICGKSPALRVAAKCYATPLNATAHSSTFGFSNRTNPTHKNQKSLNFSNAPKRNPPEPQKKSTNYFTKLKL